MRTPEDRTPEERLPVRVPAQIPTSMRGPGRLALGLIAGTLGVLLLWGSVAPLNSGAVAPGVIIAAGHSRVVQHLEGGIIRAIRVRDGDRVAAEQELLVLDDTEARAGVAIARAEESAQAALVARLMAERDGKTQLPALKRGSPSVETQARLFESRRRALFNELAGMEAQAAEARRELAGWEARQTHIGVRTANTEEESRINRSLFDKGFISRPRLLELESRTAEAAAGMAENAAEAARARQKITESETVAAKLKDAWASSLLEELRRAQDALEIARERLTVAQERLTRTRIVAPHPGTVHGLRFTTLGGVIPPGGVVVEVTPEDDPRVVEARLSPDDIDLVRPGLPAHVRLTAYKARRYFTLLGEVTQVSSNSFTEEKTGQSFYKVLVQIPDTELVSAGGMQLVPGMLAQVDIVTGERTALRYLLDPITDSFRRAMKEK